MIKVKLYPDKEFKSGFLLKDIYSPKRKDYFPEGSKIDINPSGYYITSENMCGWLDKHKDLVETVDYIVLG